MFDFIKNNITLFSSDDLNLFLSVDEITKPQFDGLSKLMASSNQ